MALTVGTQLGSYEITALLGKGGMGEVYRAKDSKLKRDVAIKILPEEFSRDPERVGRFQREAEALALLNHPNIGAIYDVQEAGASRFLVLELVEGETLAERLSREPIPVGDALKIAQLIAEALEAAHEKGIVHRDLKPANVKMTPDGKIKVLDFGLAKAMDSTTASATLSNSPTLSVAATQAGMILGTAAYMSPEQAKGFAADPRSDVFAFGCVLFEMLTGRQLFQGESIHEILGSVLVAQPDLSGLPANLNPKIMELLGRCLEKNPKRRWQAIGDVRVELEAIAADPHGLRVAQPGVQQPLWKRAIPVAGASVVFAAIGTITGWNIKPRPAPPPVARFSFSLPEGQAFSTSNRHVLAISPDGTQIVYQANQRLHIRSIGDLEARPIPGSDVFPVSPVFSPDSKSLVFYSNGSLKKIAVSGGTPVTLCTATVPYGMSWSGDEILFGQSGKGILRVSENGGQPEVVVAAKEGELTQGPQLLPDRKTVLFTLASGSTAATWDTAQIVVQPLKGGPRKILIQGGSDARYVPTGHIVYALAGTLLAVRFDLKRLEVVGGPAPVLEGVRRGGVISGAAQFSFATDGSLIYEPGPVTAATENNSAAFMDRDGKYDLLKIPADYPRISPDGKQVAFERGDKQADVWIYDLSGATAPRQLTFGGENRYPIWSFDSQRVAFQSNREGDLGIWWQRADGTGPVERLTKADQGVTHIPDSWSGTGQWFSFTSIKDGDADVWVFSVRDKKASPFVQVPKSNDLNSVFSPDGKWLAYESHDAANPGVKVQPFPSNGTQLYAISGGCGYRPLWSPDGKELFCAFDGTATLEFGITTIPAFTFGNPKRLPYLFSHGAGTRRAFDIMPDGKRFLTLASADQAQNSGSPAQQINIVLNWFTELQQRVPVK